MTGMSCCIDIPVMPGIMIGSFGARDAGEQVSVKMPGLEPPDGNPAVATCGGVAVVTAAAVTAAVPAARTRAAAAPRARARVPPRRERSGPRPGARPGEGRGERREKRREAMQASGCRPRSGRAKAL